MIRSGCCALNVACREGYVQIAKQLLDAGANVNAPIDGVSSDLEIVRLP